jgi:hypothetical protein
MIKYIEATDSKDLNRIQARAIALIGKGRETMHIALVATILHIFKHGDRTGAQTLIDALKMEKANKGTRVLVIEWLKTYGGLIYEADSKSEQYGQFVGWLGKDHIAANLEAGKANPYHQKPEKEKVFEGYDFNAELVALVDKHGKMAIKAEKMNDIDKAKVQLKVNQQTLNMVLNACGLEAILNEDAQDQLAG